MRVQAVLLGGGTLFSAAAVAAPAFSEMGLSETQAEASHC
jgi:hypothetical protein